MARITTRDCERVVPNRYELVLLATEQARALARDFSPRPDRAREAAQVTALRRIANGTADLESLRANLWRRWKHLPLLGEEESNDNAPQLEDEPRQAQAA